MKKKFKILFAILIFSSELYSQDFKDKIFYQNGDSILCKITLINQENIFYDYLNKKGKNQNTFISKKSIRTYIIDSKSSPQIIVDSEQIANLSEDARFNDTSLVNHGFTKIEYELIYGAGEELTKFSSLYFTGITILAVGITIALISTPIGIGIAGLYVGGGVASVGNVISIVSHIKIKRAGELMMKIKTLRKVKK